MRFVIHALQLGLILGTIVVYFITKRVCIALQKKDREIVLHGYESGRIVRLPGGEFQEVHKPVDEYERWKLVADETFEPLIVRPNDQGKIKGKFRAAMSRWFFEDRLQPLTNTEYQAALEHQKHALHEFGEEDHGAIESGDSKH